MRGVNAALRGGQNGRRLWDRTVTGGDPGQLDGEAIGDGPWTVWLRRFLFRYYAVEPGWKTANGSRIPLFAWIRRSSQAGLRILNELIPAAKSRRIPFPVGAASTSGRTKVAEPAG